MYVIDLSHYLDDRGAIAPAAGPARRLAEFLTAVVAAATDVHHREYLTGPGCFRCRRHQAAPVDCDIDHTGVVRWHCRKCGTEGRISGWRGTLWDLTQRHSAH